MNVRRAFSCIGNNARLLLVSRQDAFHIHMYTRQERETGVESHVFITPFYRFHYSLVQREAVSWSYFEVRV